MDIGQGHWIGTLDRACVRDIGQVGENGVAWPVFCKNNILKKRTCCFQIYCFGEDIPSFVLMGVPNKLP